MSVDRIDGPPSAAIAPEDTDTPTWEPVSTLPKRSSRSHVYILEWNGDAGDYRVARYEIGKDIPKVTGP